MKISLYYIAIILFFISCKTKFSNDLKINFINKDILVDGEIDSIWNFEPEHCLKHINLGKISVIDSKDLSCSMKLLWGKNNLYLLLKITDDIKFTNPIPLRLEGEDLWKSWKNDDIELFFDMGNNKSKILDNNDYRFDFCYGLDSIISENDIKGITFVQKNFIGGYIQEIKIPWATLKYKPRVNSKVGFELNITDNDSRHYEEGVISWAESKLAWAEERSATADVNTNNYGTLIFVK